MTLQQGMPQVIVVGDQRFADVLAGTSALWTVCPAVPTVSAMWDAIEQGKLPTDAAVLIITDGTANEADEIESTLAAFAPYSRTFIVAAGHRGPALVTRARELAASGMIDGASATAPIVALPAEDLAATLDGLQRNLSGIVEWVELGPLTGSAPLTDYHATPPSNTGGMASAAQPVGAPIGPVTPPAAPVAPPVAPASTVSVGASPAVGSPYADGGADSRDYEQSSIYDSVVQELATQVIKKRPDAIPGQVTIACMSSKGGSGKSTTAICLAGMIARASAAAGNPKKVVLVDLDTRDGQVGSLIGQYIPTAVSIRVQPRWDAQTVLANLVHDRRLGIDALLAPMRPRNADDVGPEFYRQIIQVLQTTHDVVILDCSVNYLDPLLGVGFALADEILFVTTVATTSVQGMARALNELFLPVSEGGLGIPKKKVGIVANAVINNVGMGKSDLLRAAWGAPMVGQIPAAHDDVLIATNSNRMDNLLKHKVLGPAYFELAKNCLPNYPLSKITG